MTSPLTHESGRSMLRRLQIHFLTQSASIVCFPTSAECKFCSQPSTLAQIMIEGVHKSHFILSHPTFPHRSCGRTCSRHLTSCNSWPPERRPPFFSRIPGTGNRYRFKRVNKTFDNKLQRTSPVPRLSAVGIVFEVPFKVHSTHRNNEADKRNPARHDALGKIRTRC